MRSPCRLGQVQLRFCSAPVQFSYVMPPCFVVCQIYHRLTNCPPLVNCLVLNACVCRVAAEADESPACDITTLADKLVGIPSQSSGSRWARRAAWEGRNPGIAPVCTPRGPQSRLPGPADRETTSEWMRHTGRARQYGHLIGCGMLCRCTGLEVRTNAP